MRRTIFTILMAFLLLPLGMKGAEPTAIPTPLPSRQASKVLSALTSSYADWGRVELNGRMRSSMLPMSVTARIYMEKGKCVMISLRAPLIGEAARVEIDRDSILLVNKMKRRYCRLSMDHVDEVYPGALNDLQSLLLGRLTIMGKGTLGKKLFGSVDVYPGDDGGYVAVPADKLQPGQARYGYTIDSDGALSTFMVTPTESDDLATITYQWKKDNACVMSICAMQGTRSVEAEFDLESPRFGADPMKPFELNGRYRRADLRSVLSM